jgi:hypothetical protein
MLRLDLVAVTSFVLAACGWQALAIAPPRVAQPLRTEQPVRTPRRPLRVGRVEAVRSRSLRGRHH